ncbi:hypothetical protein D9M69_564130 [compost metagenome]
MNASASPRDSRWRSTMARSSATSLSLALSAASRAIPRSKKIRALLRCSSVSKDCASMILAVGSTCWKIERAVSFKTLARSPCEMLTSPILASDCIASRIAGRPTPKRSIRTRSDGISSPGVNSPEVIMFSSRSKTSSDSLRRMMGSIAWVIASHCS